jgi:plasmid stabilization system protein ParE
MNYEVIFTDIANQDFYEILDYIATDSPQNALLFINKLQERTKKTLSTLPFSGVAYKEGFRFFVFDNYIVAYEPNEDRKQVAVYLVSERHRQWRSILDERITNKHV